jgi:hypothetical protein
MIGICRLFSCSGMPQACLKRAFCLSAHSTRALCCKIVTKSREPVMPAAAAIHVDRSDKRVCGRVGGKGECFNNQFQQPLKATFPKSGFLG